jgi:2-polyprenyl-6-hydroxyphenyl methylase/3-demethylubiquinone-9 3-methyltransferase
LRKGTDVHSERPRHKAIAEIVEGPTVLDVGCGTGDLLLQLQQKNGLELHGVDISGVALNMAEERGVKAWLWHGETWPDIKFNTIVMSQVLEHVDNDAALVKCAKEHLVSGGLLVVTVPENGKIPAADHKREYTKKSLLELLGEMGKPKLHDDWKGRKYRLLATVRNE